MKYKLVPVKPTQEMIDAGRTARTHPMERYKAMLAAAPEVDQDLVGWVVVGPGDCMSDIQTDHCHAVDLKSDMDSELPPHHTGPAHEVKPLYLHPQPAPEVAKLVEALEGLLAITDESLGVSGYHLNGDIAKWCEFEEVAMAEEALALYRQQKGEA